MNTVFDFYNGEPYYSLPKEEYLEKLCTGKTVLIGPSSLPSSFI